MYLYAARQRGVTAIQWDGGANYSVHGNWSRILPEIDLQGLTVWFEEGAPAFNLTLVADGFKREKKVPVVLISPGGTPVPRGG